MIITIGFSSAKNSLMLFARGIEFIEKRPYSHVFIKYHDCVHQKDLIFQASHGKVNLTVYNDFIKHNDVIKTYDLDFDEFESAEFFKLISIMIHRKYSWLDILGILWRKITKLKNPFKDGMDTVICSELGAMVCKIKKIPIPDHIDDVTPSDLDKILANI
jgi:hypothetical protein